MPKLWLRIRQAIETNTKCLVTVSIGIAEAAGYDCDELLVHADQALYQAKVTKTHGYPSTRTAKI